MRTLQHAIRVTLILLFLCYGVWGPISRAEAISFQSFHQKPKLVVVIVVDQFRADYLTRFQKRFLPPTAQSGTLGGYNFLMSHGAYFPFAEYDVFQNMTGPGHAMILSGSYPYQMGIPINVWLDHVTGIETYCVQDSDSPTVGAPKKVILEKVNGFSPKNFLGTTVGDELKNAGYPSRVFTVSLKDRAAILLGGHRADLALWFDSSSYRWVSSRYYLKNDHLPEWVETLNGVISSHKGETYKWDLPAAGSGLSSQPKASTYQGSVGSKEILAYPYGMQLTVDAAEAAMDANHLGKGAATDLLAVSFSSHDFLGHAYGPNAREMEELTVAEDRLISKFLNDVRGKMGGSLKDVVVVLTGDHGIPPASNWLNSAGLEAGRIDAGNINGDQLGEKIEERLNQKFGKSGKGHWLLGNSDLNYYLNPAVVADRGLPQDVIEGEAKAEILATPGVAFAFSRSDYLVRHLPPGIHESQILKGYFPARSGDLVVIPKPFYAQAGDTVTHMTGYSYDRTVPLVIMGSKMKVGVYPKSVHVVDLAPTLSFLLGILPPSMSEGHVISDAVSDK